MRRIDIHDSGHISIGLSEGRGGGPGEQVPALIHIKKKPGVFPSIPTVRGRDMTDTAHEWRRLSRMFADANGRACAAAEEAKAAVQVESARGIPFSPLTIAKFGEAVDQLAEARQLLLELIEVHQLLFPKDQKIFEVQAAIERNAESMETFRHRLLLN